jgi:hypothetical protein
MNAVRRAFPIRALAAIHVAVAISTALARAGSLPNPTEWRTGNRWIVREEAQQALLATPHQEGSASPVDVVTQNDTIGAPIECKTEITLTLRREVRRVKTHVVSLRHSKDLARRGSEPSHKLRSCPLPALTGTPKG